MHTEHCGPHAEQVQRKAMGMEVLMKISLGMTAKMAEE
jgi:hypothetical protein